MTIKYITPRRCMCVISQRTRTRNIYLYQRECNDFFQPHPSERIPLSRHFHYNDVIMTTITSQITSLTVVYSTVYSHAGQRKHQSSASLAFVWGPVNSPHKEPVTRKMFPFDDVIMSAVTSKGCLGTRIIVSEKEVQTTCHTLYVYTTCHT